MLYRTHHPFFFPFNPFTISSIPSPPPSASTTTTISPPIQVEQGMEHVEGALKGCFRPDMAAKRTQHHAILDDLCAVNGQSGVSGDDFLVEDFLDFSKGGIEDGFFQAEDEPDHEEETKPCSLSVSVDKEQQAVNKDKDSDLCRSSFSAIDDFGRMIWRAWNGCLILWMIPSRSIPSPKNCRRTMRKTGPNRLKFRCQPSPSSPLRFRRRREASGREPAAEFGHWVLVP
ncbi:hypothetical protein LOK49_LG01G02890 [Camellia lanceoleosa]|uniref:Uncharacterized protein n=1 Tax=Camellia lanceoleosa TaxID=1840588 RepID=A0ACC0IX05_9ERIC|nr:hypothetical protein LOK49_LG01G02890 [Camellia lanceoleosa]